MVALCAERRAVPRHLLRLSDLSRGSRYEKVELVRIEADERKADDLTAIEIGSRESPGVGRLRTRLANAQHQYHRRAGEQAREHGLIPKTVFA
jgi:hypothetical protein